MKAITKGGNGRQTSRRLKRIAIVVLQSSFLLFVTFDIMVGR